MSRPTIIFLHGGPGFTDYLQPFFLGLNNYFDCVFYDQVRGPDVGIEHLLSQLDEIVSGSTKPVNLAGHSWGAVLGVEYTARNPKKVSGLATMCTGLSHEHWFTEYQKEKERLGLLDASAEEIFLAPRERVEGKVFLDSSWETFSEETFDSLNKNYLANYDLTKKFSMLQIPLLNIYGELDVRFAPKVTKTFAVLNPNVVDFEVKSAGHFPFLQEVGRNQIHQALRTMFLKA